MESAGPVYEVIGNIEWTTQQMQRLCEPAPEHVQNTLYKFFDDLVDFSADHHKKKSGKDGQLISDVKYLMKMFNSDPREPYWIHYCHEVRLVRL